MPSDTGSPMFASSVMRMTGACSSRGVPNDTQRGCVIESESCLAAIAACNCRTKRPAHPRPRRLRIPRFPHGVRHRSKREVCAKDPCPTESDHPCHTETKRSYALSATPGKRSSSDCSRFPRDSWLVQRLLQRPRLPPGGEYTRSSRVLDCDEIAVSQV